MKTRLDSGWVNKIAVELEPIYKFMGHHWLKQVDSSLPHIHTDGVFSIPAIPTSKDIANRIHRLWQDLEGCSEVGSGGLYISVDERGEPMVIYRREIIFRHE